MSIDGIKNKIDKLKEKDQLTEEDKNQIAFFRILVAVRLGDTLVDILKDIINRLDRIEKHIGLDKKWRKIAGHANIILGKWFHP